MSRMAPVYRGEVFGKQIYTMHSTVVHTGAHRHQINKWCVTRRVWRLKQQDLDVWIEDACCWLGHDSNYSLIIKR